MVCLIPKLRILAPGVDPENDYKLLEQRRQDCAPEEFQTLRDLHFILHILLFFAGTILNG